MTFYPAPKRGIQVIPMVLTQTLQPPLRGYVGKTQSHAGLKSVREDCRFECPGSLTKDGPHISLVFREMWDTAAPSL